MEFAFFGKHTDKKSTSKSIDELLKIIREGRAFGLKEVISDIRSLTQKGQETKMKKSSLPCFVSTGLFNGSNGHSISEFIEDSYTGVLTLDLDKVEGEQLLNELFEKIKAIDYTLAVFRSPSGNGLKVLVKADSKYEHHKIAYEQVK